MSVMGHKRTLARCIIWAWRNFYLGNTYERIGIVMFDIRVDAGRHFLWHIAAPCVAQTSSQQRLPGRGAAWRRPDRDNSRACARPTYRLSKEFIRHAKYPDHADHRRYNPARQLACGVWAGSPSDSRTNAQYHWPACRPALAREAGKRSDPV